MSTMCLFTSMPPSGPPQGVFYTCPDDSPKAGENSPWPVSLPADFGMNSPARVPRNNLPASGMQQMPMTLPMPDMGLTPVLQGLTHGMQTPPLGFGDVGAETPKNGEEGQASQGLWFMMPTQQNTDSPQHREREASDRPDPSQEYIWPVPMQQPAGLQQPPAGQRLPGGYPNPKQDAPAPWNRGVPDMKPAWVQRGPVNPLQPPSSATWHDEVQRVGELGDDGRLFRYKNTPNHKPGGRKHNLKPLVVLNESRLRQGGRHVYTINLEGSVGKAGGFGFVFHHALERRNISQVTALFLNQVGQLCCRTNGRRVHVATEALLPLTSGSKVTFCIDLDSVEAQFEVRGPAGNDARTNVFSLQHIVPPAMLKSGTVSGFFSAVVQEAATLHLS
eukprot:TRINITY_DN22452_c0_g1_i1.p1 TRINITY_DN22452_c0_g1~~TRINITY_DN22452_c0_g1_i1.p1  ORF type:complete len:389 (-),score=77.40 TRINITY_DN22452_c0_g1_i1:339-1505(-)